MAQIATDCLRIGYFPEQLKTANTAMLKKPEKDYTIPKSYRPIALLNTIGKVIETAMKPEAATTTKAGSVFLQPQLGLELIIGCYLWQGASSDGKGTGSF